MRLGGCWGGPRLPSQFCRHLHSWQGSPGKKKRTGQICSKRCVSTWEGARPEKQASNLYARHIGYLFLSLAIGKCIFLNAVFVENGGCVAGWLPVARQAAAARECTQVRPPRAVGDARSSRNLSFCRLPGRHRRQRRQRARSSSLLLSLLPHYFTASNGYALSSIPLSFSLRPTLQARQCSSLKHCSQRLQLFQIF